MNASKFVDRVWSLYWFGVGLWGMNVVNIIPTSPWFMLLGPLLALVLSITIEKDALTDEDDSSSW